MQLTPTQIAQYAYNAGFRGSALITAVAIALSESSGNTDAYNPETAAGTPTGNGSRGLWQVYGNAHPTYNNSNAFDPQTNANEAFTISNGGTNWQPWTTYTNGNYLGNVGTASQAVASINSSNTLAYEAGTDPCAAFSAFGPAHAACQAGIGLGKGAGSAANNATGGAIGNTITNIEDASQWVSNPVRIIKVVAGIGVLLVAFLLLIAPDAAKAGISAAKDAGVVAVAA